MKKNIFITNMLTILIFVMASCGGSSDNKNAAENKETSIIIDTEQSEEPIDKEEMSETDTNENEEYLESEDEMSDPDDNMEDDDSEDWGEDSTDYNDVDTE